MVNMDFEKDYILRMIKSVGQVIMKMLGREDEKEYEQVGIYTPTEQLYLQLLEMADKGAINEAENLLFRKADTRDRRYLERAMRFYQHLEEYSDDFLLAHDYSRIEIAEGVKRMAREYGITGLERLFPDDGE